MARDRKQRAKQRRSRRSAQEDRAQNGGATAENGGATDNGDAIRDGHGAAENGGGLVRADVPGALDHASGEVDEFDAGLIRGAGGVPIDQQPATEEELAAEAAGSAPTVARAVSGRPPAAAEPKRSIGSRAVAFLRASWAELQRVQWPDRRHVFQATAVVLGFVIVAGVYLGAADWVAQKIVNFIL